MLKDKTDIVNLLIKDITPFLVAPEDNVVLEGTEGDYFYFIAEGTCQVWIRDLWDYDSRKETRDLNPGDYFGEVALLFDCYRTASVRTTNYCVIARVEKEIFLSCHKSFLDSLR